MDKASLQARLKMLDESFEQIIAQANATEGAIREVKHWLSVLDNKEKQSKQVEKE